VPATDSVETYAQVNNSVAQRKPDASHIRCMWRGTISELNKDLLVVWFTPTKDSLTDPAVKDEVAQLLERLQPGLRNNPKIEVLALNAWVPVWGSLASKTAGFTMRRDPKSADGFRPFGDGADDKRVFEAMMRAFGGYKLN
jgi:hypothetical protein